MKRVLLTGMSGTGKSTVVRELVARGYRAVDTDDGWCEPTPDGRQRWRTAAMQQLLHTDTADVLFVAGCEENQVDFYDQFDQIILLAVPVDVLRRRVATRTTNPFGKSSDELARILADHAEVEPLLRRAAGHEVNTAAPIADVVEQILGLTIHH
ncbi:MAG: AAA family ATPase [Mycobacterium sp.]